VAGQHSRAARRPKQALLSASGTTLLPGFQPEPLGDIDNAAATMPAKEGAEGETFVVRQRIATDACDLYAETHRRNLIEKEWVHGRL
jgi:hypothetical protein